MALLYDPGRYMPETAADFDGSSWMLTWDDGPWHVHDVEVGGTVYLVPSRSDATHRLGDTGDASLRSSLRGRGGSCQ